MLCVPVTRSHTPVVEETRGPVVSLVEETGGRRCPMSDADQKENRRCGKRCKCNTRIVAR
jgi:hypothetical protein